jgi:hypothetical protein
MQPYGFAVEFGWAYRRLDDATHQPVVAYPSSPVAMCAIPEPDLELG